MKTKAPRLIPLEGNDDSGNPSRPTVEAIRPMLTFSADALVDVVLRLWDTVGAHDAYLNWTESEAQRRRVELEITFRNLQKGVENRLHDELASMYERVTFLTQEVSSLKEGLEKQEADHVLRIDTTRNEWASVQSKSEQDLLERIGGLRKDLGLLQEDEAEITRRVSVVESKLQDVQGSLEQTSHKLTDDVDALYDVWNLTKEDVQYAVRSGRQRELLHGTPTLKSLITNHRDLESSFAALRRLIEEGQDSQSAMTRRLTELSTTANETRTTVDTGLKEVRELLQQHRVQVEKTTDSLEVRLTSLMNRVANLPSPDAASKKDTIDLQHAKLQELVHAMCDQVTTAKILPTVRGEIDATILQKVNEMRSELEALIAEETSRLHSIHTFKEETAPFECKPSYDLVPAASASIRVESSHHAVTREQANLLTTLQERVHELETKFETWVVNIQQQRSDAADTASLATTQDSIMKALRSIDQDKIGRKELEDCVESVVANVFDLLQSAAPNANTNESNGDPLRSSSSRLLPTLLRFRCLSCLSDGGPLFDSSRPDTWLNPSFSPSNMAMAAISRRSTPGRGSPTVARAVSRGAGTSSPRDSVPTASAAKSSPHVMYSSSGAMPTSGSSAPSLLYHAVDGTYEYLPSGTSTAMSHRSARRKLSTYYDWLKSREMEREEQRRPWQSQSYNQQQYQIHARVNSQSGPGNQQRPHSAKDKHRVGGARDASPLHTTTSLMGTVTQTGSGATQALKSDLAREQIPNVLLPVQTIGSDGKYYSGVSV